MKRPIRTKEEVLEAVQITAAQLDNPREFKLLLKKISRLDIPTLSTGEYKLEWISQKEFILTNGSTKIIKISI